MKKLIKKIKRAILIKLGKHSPTISFCQDEATQKVILAAFDTCTFVAL